MIGALRRDGHRVRVFAGPDAYPLLREVEADAVARVESLPPAVSWSGLRLLARRTLTDRERLRHDGVALVVSDGDLPSLVAARLCGVPSIAVGHGLVFGECVRPHGLPRQPWLREALKARASSAFATAKVAVNFVPLVPADPRVVVARSPLEPDLPRREATDDGRVICYFRDGAPAVVEALRTRGYRPVLFTARAEEHAEPDVRPLARGPFVAALARARAVVASAGSQLIAECVALRVPLFALYREDDDEQRLNVAMLRDARLGDGCALERFDPEVLDAFLRASVEPPALRWDAPDAGEAVRDLCARLLGNAAS